MTKYVPFIRDISQSVIAMSVAIIETNEENIDNTAYNMVNPVYSGDNKGEISIIVKKDLYASRDGMKVIILGGYQGRENNEPESCRNMEKDIIKACKNAAKKCWI